MSSELEVLDCPLPASLQDLGRPGYRRFGVPLSGALDTLCLRLANALVGNPPGAAAIEMRLVGPRLRAGAPVRVALAQAEAVIERGDGNHAPLPPWQSATLAAGEVLKIGKVIGGAGYLAVAGGFDIPPVLGSRSTYARAGFGLPLQPGMVLPVGETTLYGPERAVSPAPIFETGPIRVIAGPQLDMFTDAAWETFLSSEFTVTQEADRMGLRLSGPKLDHVAGADIVSDAVAPGTIQVPGNGQPIVLLADGQTAGGYAKIATVITADLPRLGRLMPGDTVRFAAVTVAEALAALRAQEAWLAATIAAIRPAAGEPDLAALYEANLVDGVVHAE